MESNILNQLKFMVEKMDLKCSNGMITIKINGVKKIIYL
jgi:hypothetical protein